MTSTTQKLTDGQIEQALNKLNQSTDVKWQLSGGKLYKQFKFKDFVSAMSFMQAAGEQAEMLNHHPEWCNVYNRVEVHLITHSVDGISALDFALAEKLEQLT